MRTYCSQKKIIFKMFALSFNLETYMLHVTYDGANRKGKVKNVNILLSSSKWKESMYLHLKSEDFYFFSLFLSQGNILSAFGSTVIFILLPLHSFRLKQTRGYSYFCVISRH